MKNIIESLKRLVALLDDTREAKYLDRIRGYVECLRDTGNNVGIRYAYDCTDKTFGIEFLSLNSEIIIGDTEYIKGTLKNIISQLLSLNMFNAILYDPNPSDVGTVYMYQLDELRQLTSYDIGIDIEVDDEQNLQTIRYNGYVIYTHKDGIVDFFDSYFN